MKKLVFLFSFLLGFSTFAKDVHRGAVEYKKININSPAPCSPKVSQLQGVAALSSIIDKRANIVKGSTTYQDKRDTFPAVGMVNLDGAHAGHGSGTLIGLKDENGIVLKNKVMTSAHVIFKEKKNEYGEWYVSGELKVPIESINFLMGYDVNNEEQNFKVTKLECDELSKDLCVLTLDRDAPFHIKPMTPISDPDPYLKNADLYYFIGYPSWAVNHNKVKIGHQGQRFFSKCKQGERYPGTQSLIFACNVFAGNSGGAAVVSKKQPDGTWKDYYVGTVRAPGNSGETNFGQALPSNKVKDYNKYVITSENQRQFLALNYGPSANSRASNMAHVKVSN